MSLFELTERQLLRRILSTRDCMTKFKIQKSGSFVFMYERKWFCWERIQCTAFRDIEGAFNFILKLQRDEQKSFCVRVIVDRREEITAKT